MPRKREITADQATLDRLNSIEDLEQRFTQAAEDARTFNTKRQSTRLAMMNAWASLALFHGKKAGGTVQISAILEAGALHRPRFTEYLTTAPADLPQFTKPEDGFKAGRKRKRAYEQAWSQLLAARQVRDATGEALLRAGYNNAALARLSGLTTARVAQLWPEASTAAAAEASAKETAVATRVLLTADMVVRMPERDRALAAARMSEATLDTEVRALLAHHCLRCVYHAHDSRRSHHGLPDWVIVGQAVLWRELKTATGKCSPAQLKWLEMLQAAGEDADVWRPADLLDGRVDRELAAIAPVGP